MPASAQKLADRQAAEHLDHHGSDVENVLGLKPREEVDFRLPVQ